MVDDLGVELAERLGARFAREGLPVDAGLAPAVAELNQRLRTNRGEYAI
jgi:hypothetical protein